MAQYYHVNYIEKQHHLHCRFGEKKQLQTSWVGLDGPVEAVAATAAPPGAMFLLDQSTTTQHAMAQRVMNPLK